MRLLAAATLITALMGLRGDSLRIGMSPTDVITKLGSPTHVGLPSDEGEWGVDPFEAKLGITHYWYWDQPKGCMPWSVMFDAQGATGWDVEDRCWYDEVDDKVHPPAEMSCQRPDRRKHCR